MCASTARKAISLQTMSSATDQQDQAGRNQRDPYSLNNDLCRRRRLGPILVYLGCTMEVPWIQPRHYSSLQHAPGHTDLGTRNRSLGRRWKGYHEEPVLAQMAEVMVKILSQIQEQRHGLHQELAAPMSTSTRKPFPRNTTSCLRLDCYYFQRMWKKMIGYTTLIQTTRSRGSVIFSLNGEQSTSEVLVS